MSLYQLPPTATALPGAGFRALRDTWLDKQDLLQWLHISERTLQGWRSKGLLPYSAIGGKLYYRLSDVEALLEQHLVRGGKGEKK